ncbi:MAG: type I 3-dehydroquinate dehydratase [Armatimonadetes bacterium]|nr:type I 3-dehydroquinate dehydratase [Akkermansiaceae bacterium]
MSRLPFIFPNPATLIVGSFGDLDSIIQSTPASLAEQCDLVEIRLDLYHKEIARTGPALWHHLLPFPILFTARRHSEGSPYDLNLRDRMALLKTALPDATMIDIEAISTSEMSGLISEIISEKIPWIASYHDFQQLPSRQKLLTHAEIAREAGATAFKVAARLQTMDDLTELAHFQMSDPGIPLSTMGMGVLAPVSRLLCAQAGSVLNYGFIGEKSTAPGQWSARQLRESIRSLNPYR